MLDFDFAYMPQLNIPRASCTVVIQDEILYVMYGKCYEDTNKRTKRGKNTEVNIVEIEWAKLDDVLNFVDCKVDDKMVLFN